MRKKIDLQLGNYYKIMHASGVDTPEDIAQCYLSNIFNVTTLPKKVLVMPKKAFLGYLPLFLHLLQKKNLLLKHVERKCWSETSSTRKFRSHCSCGVPLESSKSIACQFACRYLSAASANFFELQVFVMLCSPFSPSSIFSLGTLFISLFPLAFSP